MQYLKALSILTLLILWGESDGIKFSGLDSQTEVGLSENVIQFLRPYSFPIRKWFWQLSGEDYPTTLDIPQSRAEYLGCDLCVNGVPFVRELLDTGISDEVIVGVLALACHALNLAPRPDICDPIIRSYAISIAFLLRNKPDMSTDDFCGILTPGCVEVSSKYTNWTIRLNQEKPPLLPRPDLPPGNAGATKIIQFTDIHLDLDYTVGTNSECSLPICCRPADGIPTNASLAAGKFGEFECGLPEVALRALYEHARDSHSDARFIFLTGDYVHSGVWLYNALENGRHIEKATALLKEVFQDSPIEIYPVVGNHEPDVVNMYPPESVWDTFNLTWMYDAVSAPFPDFIPPTQLNLFKKYGYYTVTPKNTENLRLIVLNTNLCYINNFWLPYDPIDTFGQLQWFADTLSLAETLGQKVIILGHIYPGSGSCWPVWSHQFNRIVNRYEALITSQFYGHTHQYNYKVAMDPEGDGRPIGVSYVGGSALTSGMNSGYNVYHADGERGVDSSWEILNHEAYILKLKESNSNQDGLAIFQQILDAKADFGVKSMVPEEIYALINRMVCNDVILLKYQTLMVKGEDSSRYRPCGNDTSCKAGILSNLFAYSSADSSYKDRFENHVLNMDCDADENGSSGAFTYRVALLLVIFSILLTVE